MKSPSEFCRKIIMSGKVDGQPNEQGNTVHRVFAPTGRYLIDFADDFKAEQWEQYDTDQDAEYFGVWINKVELRVLTYAEGDWTLVCCIDKDHFNAEIRALNEFHGEGKILTAIDLEAGTSTVYRQDRSEFTIA